MFRPRTGLAACALWFLLAALWLLLDYRSGWLVATQRLPLIALISTAVYAVFGRPRVVVGASGVLLQNVLRDVDVPYSELAKVDTQYALTLTTVDGRRFQAWAAPASGRFGAARITDEDRKTLTWSGPADEIPASATLRSDAGAAAVAIRRSWSPRINTETTTSEGSERVQIRWATRVLVILGGFALVSVVIALG